MEYYWFVQAIAYCSLVVFIVPYEDIKRLLYLSFLGGFVYTWVVQYVAVVIFRFWTYKPTFLTFYGIPFFFSISWSAAVILYGYFLTYYSEYQIYILSFFVFWTVTISYFPQRLKIQVFHNWSLLLTLMVAISSHVFLLYLLKWLNKVEVLGPNKDILNLKHKEK